jgi:hypothetical protein
VSETPEPDPGADPTGASTPDDDLAVVATELARVEPGRVAIAIRALGLGVQGACATLAATTLAAVAVGVRAWPGSVPVQGAGVALVLASAGTSLFIARRVRRLADAVSHPADVVAQARDLVGRAKGSPELGRLALRLRGRGAAKRATGVGRVRRLVSSGRLVSAVIGLADPDPDRHGLLLPFTPVRLRSLWLAITAALWIWVASVAVGALGALALVSRALS